MKFRQHIRVYGFPDALKVKINDKRRGRLNIDGVGELDVFSDEKANRLKALLAKHNIGYKETPRKQQDRIRYLCMKGVGITKSIRGRKYKGDILFTIESDDERELLDKRDAAIEELKSLRVKYEDVCKWVCESAPKLDTQKTFKPKRKTVTEKLEAKVEGIQQELAELKEKPIKKAMVEDRKTMKGVLE